MRVDLVRRHASGRCRKLPDAVADDASDGVTNAAPNAAFHSGSDASPHPSAADAAPLPSADAAPHLSAADAAPEPEPDATAYL